MPKRIVKKQRGKGKREVMEDLKPMNPYDAAMARADLVVSNGVGLPAGEIQNQEERHRNRWAELTQAGAEVREQILTLKARENDILRAIRDRQAEHLMDVLDAAEHEGLLPKIEA